MLADARNAIQTAFESAWDHLSDDERALVQRCATRAAKLRLEHTIQHLSEADLADLRQLEANVLSIGRGLTSSAFQRAVAALLQVAYRAALAAI